MTKIYIFPKVLVYCSTGFLQYESFYQMTKIYILPQVLALYIYCSAGFLQYESFHQTTKIYILPKLLVNCSTGFSSMRAFIKRKQSICLVLVNCSIRFFQHECYQSFHVNQMVIFHYQ